ncbi:crotonase/enoyl-CoA hydratase family protein [Actinomadura sp. LD22]|uniref:Crotonase/enoyl-CoA hydratase family protein n=1 Tax=Actinomadura physcomitrii TaxID=2650748 RepID=A0A6I4MF99_9ACTN|nr:crotonase/enoyl-CoA hydratase family protein [Actinomadura physcomitrii]MWA04888.1 crotonase/enoyl-CoA hydratase family protein [Actinomadura physcomitrii]
MDCVLCEVSDGVADVRLNRPDQLNALNDAMFAQLIAVGERLLDEPGLRAVVLSGAGRAFCAGLDFTAFRAQADAEPWRPEAVAQADGQETPAAPRDDFGVPGLVLPRGQKAVWVWQALEVPVIAAVHGFALGGGLQIALGADIRLVSADARLGVLEMDWGLTPDMCGTQILPRLVGLDVAKELALTARKVTGEEAVRIGLATRVCPDPRAEALAMANTIARRNSDAVRAAKSLLNRAWDAEAMKAGFRAERDFMERNVGSPLQREAVRTRLESMKRP